MCVCVLEQGSKGQEFFKLNIRQEIAGALKIPFARLKVVDVVAASVRVRIQILPSAPPWVDGVRCHPPHRANPRRMFLSPELTM